MPPAKKTGSRRSKPQGLREKVHWGEAVLTFFLGYFAKPALIATGLPWFVYNAAAGTPYAAAIDAGYAQQGGGSNPDNPFANGGTGFMTKTAGVLMGGKTVYDMTKRAPTEKDVSVKLPFSLGLILDPPAGGGMFGMGGSGPAGEWS